MRTEGRDGMVNPNGNLCKYGKFGYKYLNSKSRITKPLLKVNGRFEEIEYEEAFKIIAEKIKAATPDDNAFFAGARLSNEEMFLIQKLARAFGLKKNALQRDRQTKCCTFASIPKSKS